jgi:hypothetical protein
VKQGKTRVPGKADFTRHMIRFRHRSLKDVRSGDSVLEVALLNSHDGTSSWEIMGALWRVSCLNALVSGGTMLINHKVPHKGDQLHNVIEGTYAVVEESKQLAHVPEDWGAVQLKADEARALAKAAHALRFEDTDGQLAQAIKPEALLATRRFEDREPNLWHTFNRIQENAFKGGLAGTATLRDPDTGRMRQRRVTTRPINNIEQDVKLNRALWVLAEEMRKIKG